MTASETMNRTIPKYSLDVPASASTPLAAAWAVEPPLRAPARALIRSAYPSQHLLQRTHEVVGCGVLTVEVSTHLPGGIDQHDARGVCQLGTAGRRRTG